VGSFTNLVSSRPTTMGLPNLTFDQAWVRIGTNRSGGSMYGENAPFRTIDERATTQPVGAFTRGRTKPKGQDPEKPIAVFVIFQREVRLAESTNTCQPRAGPEESLSRPSRKWMMPKPQQTMAETHRLGNWQLLVRAPKAPPTTSFYVKLVVGGAFGALTSIGKSG